jgi:hypothetical protein
MERAVSVDVEDPGVLVKGFLELANIIVIEAVDVELNNPKDFLVVICPRSHGRDLPSLDRTTSVSSLAAL